VSKLCNAGINSFLSNTGSECFQYGLLRKLGRTTIIPQVKEWVLRGAYAPLLSFLPLPLNKGKGDKGGWGCWKKLENAVKIVPNR